MKQMRAETRSAAPIHRAVFQPDCPMQTANLRKPTGHEGHGQRVIRDTCGILGSFLLFCVTSPAQPILTPSWNFLNSQRFGFANLTRFQHDYSPNQRKTNKTAKPSLSSACMRTCWIHGERLPAACVYGTLHRENGQRDPDARGPNL